MKKIVNDICDKIIKDEYKFILISGNGAAGKSTLANILKDELKKELAFLKRNLIPNLLKHQLGRCNRSDETNKPLIFEEFSKELVDLNNKSLISWRGHKLSRYLLYKKLIKGSKK